MLLDAQQRGNLLVRLFLEHVEVEHRPATCGQPGQQLHQHLLREAVGLAACHRLLVGTVGQLLFVHHQAGKAFALPQEVDGLGHHDPRQPRLQGALTPVGEVRERLDKPIVQHVVGSLHIARVAVAHGQHLLGITDIQLLAGSLLVSVILWTPSRAVYLKDGHMPERLPLFLLKEVKRQSFHKEYITVKEIQHALKLMSKPLTEWVNAPTEMKSTPHSA